MTGKELRTMFRNRLPLNKNPEYLAWLAEYDKKNVGHHWTGSNFKRKLHDLLIAKIPDEVHKKIENGIPVDGYSEEEMLMMCVELNHKYIEYLQKKGDDNECCFNCRFIGSFSSHNDDCVDCTHKIASNLVTAISPEEAKIFKCRFYLTRL